MKRSFIFSTSLSVGAITLLTAAPAFGADDDVFGTLVGGGLCAVYACAGILGLLSLVFWIWMIVDLVARQEYEFPNSTGNSKTMWILIMVGSWFLGMPLVAAIVYYFMVYKKIRRGAVQPPMAGPSGYQPPMAPPPAPPAPPTPPAPPAPPVE